MEDAKKFNTRETLFEKETTDYSKLNNLIKDFQPYVNLWVNANKWFVGVKSWVNDPWDTVDAEAAEKILDEGLRSLAGVVRYMRDREIPGV